MQRELKNKRDGEKQAEGGREKQRDSAKRNRQREGEKKRKTRTSNRATKTMHRVISSDRPCVGGWDKQWDD